MKITAIELNSEEQDEIFNYLVRKFDSEYHYKQYAEFDLSDFCDYGYGEITADSELELYIESEMTDTDTNSSQITERSVMKFRLTFYYDGEEIKVNDWNIDDRISEYYRV